MSGKKAKKPHPNWDLKDDLRFEDTFGVCLCSHEESHTLWEKWHDGYGVDWEQLGAGWMGEIGKIDDRPIWVTVFWTKIHGRLIAFVDGTSQLVDHKMIEDWAEKVFFNAKHTASSASNFHIVVHPIARELGVESIMQYDDWGDRQAAKKNRKTQPNYMKPVKKEEQL